MEGRRLSRPSWLVTYLQGAALKNHTLRKIKFIENYRYILLCFSMFNAEVITYHTCEFCQNILLKNTTMAVRIQKCSSLSEQQLK